MWIFVSLNFFNWIIFPETLGYFHLSLTRNKLVKTHFFFLKYQTKAKEILQKYWKISSASPMSKKSDNRSVIQKLWNDVEV